MIFPTPDYLRKCFDASKSVLASAQGRIGDVNVSDVLTVLIQKTGQYVEAYANGLLLDVNHVMALTMAHEVTKDKDSIVGLGLRRNGVDGNSYVMHRLGDTIGNPYDTCWAYPKIEACYRKLLAVRVTTEFGTNACKVVLKDLTDTAVKMKNTDMNWNPEDEVRKYKQKHPDYADDRFNHWACVKLVQP